MFTLRSDRLAVSLCEPGETPNTTLRFDRAGFITQVTLDGRHSFCTVEPDKPELPRTGGRGICSEIKADTISDARVGAYFHKFGVGLLVKPDGEPYNFRKRYACVPYQTDARQSGAGAFYKTDTPLCCGYALREEKTVRVEDNLLVIDYRFQNTGEKPLELGEYCHNFINIDDFPVGPEYYLEMPVADQTGKKPERGGGSLKGQGNGFTFGGFFDEGTSLHVELSDIAEGNFWWELRHTDSAARIREEDSFFPGRVLIWAIGRNISPEIYHVFRLESGEEIRYRRTFRFDD